jgi:drug/metabolite transporter (DMT)-like permease
MMSTKSGDHVSAFQVSVSVIVFLGFYFIFLHKNSQSKVLLLSSTVVAMYYFVSSITDTPYSQPLPSLFLWCLYVLFIRFIPIKSLSLTDKKRFFVSNLYMLAYIVTASFVVNNMLQSKDGGDHGLAVPKQVKAAV